MVGGEGKGGGEDLPGTGHHQISWSHKIFSLDAPPPCVLCSGRFFGEDNRN